MKVSINWLKKYVDINVPVEELCDKMVMAGFEVEEITDLSKTMDNVVVGKITRIEPHPDSDHLQICQIDVGQNENVQIITGAQNVFEGAFVPAALHNSHLPNGAHIKNGKLRGLPSNGMLCSGEELCLKEGEYPGAEVNGILILADNIAAPGTDMREILGLNDYIVDFKITANRPDCQCILGIAREAGVVLGTEFRMPKPVYKTVGGDIADVISVDVKNYDLCPRYYGRAIKNVRIGDSPEWMKRALIAAGMRPINNIVDITNFVMLETNQPMHAFDMNYIKGKKIVVRNAENGEKMTTLDGKSYDLTSDMLVIADGDSPSCLAGIMGGLESEIHSDTDVVFLESAKFRRDSVRKTCRALGIRTEAGAHFERGVDILNVEYAMNRALQLICELDAADIIDGYVDCNNGLPTDRKLSATVDSINALLGLHIPGETMCDILNKLEIKTTLENGTLNCLVPSVRDDVESRADLAEEVMRIYGYEHIIGSDMTGAVVRGKKTPERIKSDKIKALLCGEGLHEIATYSFISRTALDTLMLPADDKRRKAAVILNPLGEEYSVMRTQLYTSLLAVISTNYNRKNTDARFFEISKLFIPKSLPLTEQPLEVPAMSIGMYGENEDFFTLKGVVESVINLFCKDAEIYRSAEPFLHPGRQAVIKKGDDVLAVLGEVHPTVAEKYNIGTRVYVAQIALDKLFAIEQSNVIYKPLPKFPAVNRDFALVCDIDKPVGELEKAIKTGAGKLCEKVELFDLYSGSQIGAGKKSAAFRVTLRSADATLTEEQINKTVAKIMNRLEAAGAVLRR